MLEEALTHAILMLELMWVSDLQQAEFQLSSPNYEPETQLFVQYVQFGLS